jgi:hypothetical protein
MNYNLIFNWWALAITTALVINYIANTYVAAYWGEYWAQIYKTLVIILIVLFWAEIYAIQGYQLYSILLVISCLWLELSETFELVFGHYILGSNWDTLLQKSQTKQNQIWSFLLLTAAIAPTIITLIFKI